MILEIQSPFFLFHLICEINVINRYMAAESAPSHGADCAFLARKTKKVGLHIGWGENLGCGIHRGADEQLL